MKRKQRDELRQKSIKELELELAKREKELIEARFKLAQGQLKDVHLPAKIREEISFIKTIVSEKKSDKVKGSQGRKRS